MDLSNSKTRPFKILLHGLDSAGKTSLWHALKPEEIKTTLNFKIEVISFAGMKTAIWDIIGRGKVTPLRQHHYLFTDGFAYVIDSNDKERLDESIDELNHSIFQEEETRNTVIMVLANKQDIATALPVETIEERVREKISLNGATLGGRSVFVKGCSAITTEGLFEAFSVFIEQIVLQKAEKLSPGFLKIDSTKEETDSDKKSKIQALNGKNESYFHGFMKFFDIPFLKSVLFY